MEHTNRQTYRGAMNSMKSERRMTEGKDHKADDVDGDDDDLEEPDLKVYNGCTEKLFCVPP